MESYINVTHLSRFQLWGFAIKHIDRFNSTLEHADGAIEHAHEMAEVAKTDSNLIAGRDNSQKFGQFNDITCAFR